MSWYLQFTTFFTSQLNQGTLMNIIGNNGVLNSAGNQLPAGLVQGQNILVNGQMLNLGGLALPLQQTQNNNSTQGTVNVAGINSTGNRQQFTASAGSQQMIIQQSSNGQQQIMIQPKNTPSPSILNQPNAVSGNNQRLLSTFQPKAARTPTPSANSASSTPVPTPTPSTPTPTPTPDPGLGDFGKPSSKSSQNVNILEEALKMANLDLESYDDSDFNFFDDSICDPIPSVTPPPAPTPTPSFPSTAITAAATITTKTTKSQAEKKPKSKSSKAKSKIAPSQPTVNVTVNSNLLNQTSQNQNTQAQNQTSQNQKVNVNQQQKIITHNGQMYFISANGQKLVIQQRPPALLSSSQASATANVSKLNMTQPTVSVHSVNSNATSTPRSSINIPIGSHRPVKSSFGQPAISLAQIIKTETQVNLKSIAKPQVAQSTNQLFIKGSQSQSVSSSSTTNLLPQIISTSSAGSQKQTVQIKNQQISTLSGKIIKQEPIIKRELSTEAKPPFSFFDSQSQQSSSIFPTTSVLSVNAPHVGSSAALSLSTTASSSQPTTIMSVTSSQFVSDNQSLPNMACASQPSSLKAVTTVRDSTLSQPQIQTSSHSSSSKASVSTCLLFYLYFKMLIHIYL